MLALNIFYLRYDDDLDDVEEEDHFEDVDDLEVKSPEKLSLSLSTEMSQLRRMHMGHIGGLQLITRDKDKNGEICKF